MSEFKQGKNIVSDFFSFLKIDVEHVSSQLEIAKAIDVNLVFAWTAHDSCVQISYFLAHGSAEDASQMVTSMDMRSDKVIFFAVRHVLMIGLATLAIGHMGPLLTS